MMQHNRLAVWIKINKKINIFHPHPSSIVCYFISIYNNVEEIKYSPLRYFHSLLLSNERFYRPGREEASPPGLFPRLSKTLLSHSKQGTGG